VVELRQYTLRPGQRDVLIELFDREFVESQEAVGMDIIGQFRDLDRPERFVWIRGFADMEQRQQALTAFYQGPVWKTFAEEANATMVDVDDVLLLRAATPATHFIPLPPRPPHGLSPGRPDAPAARIAITICLLRQPVDPGFVDRRLRPALRDSGWPALAVLVEETSENTFPALPVRTGEHVVAWVQRSSAGLDHALRHSHELALGVVPGLVAPPTQLRLEPTSRSRLR
jgi:hypothetical protein